MTAAPAERRVSRKVFLLDLLWFVVSCGLWAASFHPLDLWPLAWVALVPAFIRIASPAPGRRRLGLVWVIGQYGLHACLMGWAGVIATPLAFLTPLLGIPFSWLTGVVIQHGVLRLRLPLPFVAPLAIVLVEVLRDQALLGLSWASIGYSQWRWLDLVQLAAAGRVHLVSLVVLIANAAIAAAILRARAQAPLGARIRPLLGAAAALALALAGGRILRPSGLEEGPLGVGLQPNIPQREKRRPDLASHLRLHGDLIRRFRVEHPESRPDLLVYAETAFHPIWEPELPLDRFLARELAPSGMEGRLPIRSLVLSEPDQTTVLGVIIRKKIPDSERGGPADDDADGLDEKNVAWVVRGGAPTDRVYVKRGLAPFGEFIPLPKGLPGRDLLKKLIHGAVGYVPGLNRGTAPVLFEAASPEGPARGGLTICFELVFPWYYRESAALGADFHVNISNDAWFDGSSELALVDVAGIFRAVESGRSLFRVSNSGISTLIGPDGARRAVVEGEGGRRTQVRGYLLGRIPIWRGRTAYVSYGDWPWILPAIALLSVLLLATIRAKRSCPAA